MSRLPRVLVIVAVCMAAACALPFAALAVVGATSAPESFAISDGVTVAGVPVGGMHADEAVRAVRDGYRPAALEPVTVRAGGRSFRVTARQARVQVDVERAVREAVELSRPGGVLDRGWRRVFGHTYQADVPVAVTADRDRIARRVERVARAVRRKPTGATMHWSLTSVWVTGGQAGRELADPDAVTEQIASSFTDTAPAAADGGKRRVVRAGMRRPAPSPTVREVWAARPVSVTVSRSARLVRVFRHGRLVKTYRVAVGEPRYPTSTGLFAVQSMQIDPVWTVPQSDWAGALAGKVIPAGDPRNPLISRWVGFAGAVGFHGTSSIGSIGRAASHGCVRMRPVDVRDLYRRVTVGTPVLVV